MKNYAHLSSRCKLIPFAAILAILATGQLHGQCTSPDQLPGSTCETAPLLCLQGLCYDGIPEPGFGGLGFCGPNTALHNPVYYEMIATEDHITLEISVGDCTGGQNALQSAILAACPWEVTDVLDCHPGAPSGSNIYLEATGLQVGQSYWLLIDGSAGSSCSFTITQTSGIYAPEIIEELNMMTASPPSVLPGSFALTVEVNPPIPFAQGYYWVAGWDGDTVTSTLPSIILDVPCDLPAGFYSICARAYSGCDTTDTEVCATIEVLESIDTIIKPAETFCIEEFPITWYNTIIDEPGTITQSFLQPSGCYIDSIWQVDAYPESAIGIIDTSVCRFAFTYEGQSFDESGVYLLPYPGQGVHGCDSLAELHLTLHGLDAYVESICMDSTHTIRPIILEHTFPQDPIAFSWFDCSFDTLLSTSPDFVLDTPGCYCLVLDHGFCSDTICSTYDPSPCEAMCSIVEETSCPLDTVLFAFDGEIPEGATLHWLMDRPGFKEPYHSGLDTLFIPFPIPGCYRASLTIVDSNSTFTCIDSFCILAPASTASICCSEASCDSCATLTVVMAGTAPWTLYLSDGVQTDTISGITTSPYVVTVCPPADSTVGYFIEVKDDANECPAEIQGENPVYITLYSDPVAAITQTGDLLCADGPAATAYHWFFCGPGSSLGTSPCYQATFPGCYCVELINENGCRDTACYDYIINSVSEIENASINVSPVPSNGTWSIALADHVLLPVEWSLIDLRGTVMESGTLSGHISSIQLRSSPGQGLYYLRFLTEGRHLGTSKVVIQTN